MEPLVSVVMPIYNCEPFLDEAIRSIRDQSFTNFELVAVNDGSTDGSAEVIDAHAAADPRVVAVHQVNGGIVSALNTGLSRAKGSLIARMDGDDIALPDRLKRQVEYLEQNTQVDAVGTGAQFIDESGRKGELHILPAFHREINAALSQASYAILHPTLMVRSSAIRSIGGYDPAYRIAEDLDLFLRLGESFQLANLTEVLLLYRRRSNSQTASYRGTCAQWDRRALSAAKGRGRKVPATEIARLWDRASWAAVSDGDYRSGLKHARKALIAAPLSLVGPKAILRLLWRFIAHKPSPTRS